MNRSKKKKNNFTSYKKWCDYTGHKGIPRKNITSITIKTDYSSNSNSHIIDSENLYMKLLDATLGSSIYDF